MFVTHCKKNGQKELFGEELGSRGNPGFHFHHLLRQDRYPDPEQNDRGPHVVRQKNNRN